MAKVGEEPSGEALRRHVEALCRWHRVSGQQGEAEAAAYISSALDGERIPHEVHEFQAYVSYPRGASLALDPPPAKPLRLITHSFSPSTPTEGITAPLAFAGSGSPEEIERADVGGKIALTWGMALPWLTPRLQAAGAVGHVNACRNRLPHEMCMSPIWGTPELQDLSRLPGIPIASTDEEGGRALEEALEAGRVVATLRCSAWTGWARLQLPVAHVKGPRTSNRFVLVGSHYDSWYEGATDTATTDALLLEMARLLWRKRGALRRGVRIAWWPGHSQGRYAGSAWYADRCWRELHRDAVAYVNLDGGGAKNASIFVLAHTAELGDFNRATVEGLTGWPVEEATDDELLDIRGRPARNADQSFLGIGVPSMAAYSEMSRGHTDRGAYAAASGGGWWWHTPEDTPDKVDIDVLRLETTLFTTQVFHLATAKVLPYVMKHTAEDFLNALHLYRTAAGDYLDFGPAREQAGRFREDCGNLEVHKRAVEAKGDDWKAASLEETLLRVTRILNPVLYTERGPFHPDPATPSGLLPGLRGTLGLKGLPQDQVAFALVGLHRELNRVAQALDEASAVLEAHLREEMEED
jgi:hypothetical protein